MSKYNRVSPVKVIMIILAVLLIFAAAALAVFIYGDNLRQETINSDVDSSFLFGTCKGNVNSVSLEEELISFRSMENYNGEVSRLSSGYYLERLKKGDEKEAISLYNALIYAYNNDYNFISVPSAYYTEDIMVKAVYYANGDLPIMDSNIQIGAAESSITLADGTVSKRYYVYLPTGSTSHLNYKRKAVDEAKRLVAAMPETVMTEMQKAEYWHDWMVQNVRYTTEEGYAGRNPHYLYDALIGKCSDFDGISRAYTLLLNASGVECTTIFRNETNLVSAYTWNIFRAESAYYQTDVTQDMNVYTLGIGNLKQNFCLSASAMGNGEYHRILRADVPVCDATSHDNDHVDAVVPGTDTAYKDAEGMIALRQRLDNGEEYVTLRCPVFAEKEWPDNFAVVSRWFADTKVSFKVSNTGTQTVVLYRKGA